MAKWPAEWTEDDLEALVHDGVQESISLDFKACDALRQAAPSNQKKSVKDEVSKDVSALANSAGGTVVYSIKEDQKHIATSLDSGFDRQDPNDPSKEWLDQVITSRIHQRIDGVLINAVPLTGTSPGHVAYVVYVPQSLRGAHQASDKRYYKRYNFKSEAMEDYEIRDVNSRASRPALTLDVVELRVDRQPDSTVAAVVQFEVLNDSTVVASFFAVTFAPLDNVDTTPPTITDWRWLAEEGDRWRVIRAVVATGTSKLWSPIPSGFRLPAEYLTLRFKRRETTSSDPQLIGLARLDHDGGTAFYTLYFHGSGPDLRGRWFSLRPGMEEIFALYEAQGMVANLPSYLDPRLVNRVS